jgi:hypothetical protein
MGQQQCSTINIDHPSRCMVLKVIGRRYPQEQVLLIPVTPATMPNPQSPLCLMLNDSQNLPCVLQWAWPAIHTVETEVLSSRPDPFSPDRLPLGATFAHALPGNPSRQSNNGIEVGHLISFIAIETPAGFPIPALAPVGDQQNSTFFEFSDSWMNSLCRTEGCSVVGYFRYLQLFDEVHVQAEPENPHGVADGAPFVSHLRRGDVVGVIDHYVYQSFRSEARALMLLQSVSFYVLRLATPLGESAQFPSLSPLYLMMRCRSGYIPQLRVLQKLYRMLCGTLEPLAPPVHEALGSLEALSSRIEIDHQGSDGLCHVYFYPELVSILMAQLGAGVRCDPHSHAAALGYDTARLPTLGTPFDQFIAQYRDQWREDNEQFKSQNAVSASQKNSKSRTLAPQQQPRRFALSPVVFTSSQHVDRSPSSFAGGSQSSFLNAGNGDSGEWNRFDELHCRVPCAKGVAAAAQLCRQGTNADPGWQPAFDGPSPLPLRSSPLFPLLTPSTGSSSSSSLRQQSASATMKTEGDQRQPINRNLDPNTLAFPSAEIKRRTKSRERAALETFLLMKALQQEETAPPSASTAPFETSVNRLFTHQPTGEQRLLTPVLLQVKTPIQFNRGDGQWSCGYWIEPFEVLHLTRYDPIHDETALLEHVGPITVRPCTGGRQIVTPTGAGKVYIAVAPQARVQSCSFSLSQPLRLGLVFESVKHMGTM